MKIFLLVILCHSFLALADWGKAYEQEKITYKGLEEKLSQQFKDIDRKTFLSHAIKELRKLESLFYLQKFVHEELSLGVFNPTHFVWAIESQIRTEDFRAIRKNLRLWKKKSPTHRLGAQEQNIIDYASFMVSKAVDPDDRRVKKLLETTYRDKVIDQLVMKSLSRKDLLSAASILKMKQHFDFQDKILLSILGNCEFGMDFKRFCHAQGADLNRLKSEFPEIQQLDFF